MVLAKTNEREREHALLVPAKDKAARRKQAFFFSPAQALSGLGGKHLPHATEQDNLSQRNEYFLLHEGHSNQSIQ